MFDTIAAISTPLGEGGIGIVRISGKEALLVADRVCRLKKGESVFNISSHTINYGFVIDPATNSRIDEALVSVMLGPRTYTGEDVVEINCHGGIVPLRKVLDTVLANGAVLAEEGEFTKRAFLNGRLDLAQAEAVIDIIRSRTEKGMDLAVSQLAGYLSSEVNDLRDEVLELLAFIEASIDFPEEDIEELGIEEIKKRISQVGRGVERLLEGSKKGRIYREGIRMVIAGRPNVGKSSLLNALMKEKRAIVTDIPGTTRDVIEELINIKGIPIRIVDTAGIRTTSDLVERIGVEKTLEYLERADLVLMVLDSEVGVTSEDMEIIGNLGGKPVVFVLNKIDVKNPVIFQKDLDGLVKGRPLVEISATLEIGLSQLEEVLAEMILGGQVHAQEQGMVTRLRHVESLRKAARHLEQALEGCFLGIAPDLLSVDLRGAWEALGEITGDTTSEDVLDRIFAEFCIGK
ncbi:MAG: tRNA uridine-5-carboxymethylaminomethyl(34) synthesis GTPase MnmE [Bacillota bacterium]